MKCQTTAQELVDRKCWDAFCKRRNWGLYNEDLLASNEPLTLTEAEARECGLIGGEQVNQELLAVCKDVRADGALTTRAEKTLDTAIANAKPQAVPPSEVIIENVRAAARSLGIEPDWKEAYEELYRSFQERLKRQEAFMEKLLTVVRAQGEFDHTFAIAIGAGDESPADP